MNRALSAELFQGADALIAGLHCALGDTIGIVTILFIKIQVIQEMSITTSLGVCGDHSHLPRPASGSCVLPEPRRCLPQKTRVTVAETEASWPGYRSQSPLPRPLISTGMLIFGVWQPADIRIDDLHREVPEPRRYNIDGAVISDRFSSGVDVITVIVETIEKGCIDWRLEDIVLLLR